MRSLCVHNYIVRTASHAPKRLPVARLLGILTLIAKKILYVEFGALLKFLRLGYRNFCEAWALDGSLYRVCR